MKPLADYSHIRGFNYTPSYAQNDLDFWNNYRHDVVDREMGYAQRLGLNSARIFLAYKAYLPAVPGKPAGLCPDCLGPRDFHHAHPLLRRPLLPGLCRGRGPRRPACHPQHFKAGELPPGRRVL